MNDLLYKMEKDRITGTKEDMDTLLVFVSMVHVQGLFRL